MNNVCVSVVVTSKSDPNGIYNVFAIARAVGGGGARTMIYILPNQTTWHAHTRVLSAERYVVNILTIEDILS